MKAGTIGVTAVAVALVAGGLFFGVAGMTGDGDTADSIPLATLPPSTVAPPDPAVVDSQPVQPPSTATSPEDDETLPVPNVIGVNQATAEARLVNFAVDVTTVIATDAEFFDEVIEQSPAQAERLPAGGTVFLTVSLQPRPETMPADPFPVGEVTASDLSGLEPGDCANYTVVDEILVYEPVDCDEFHDAQLIARFDLQDAPAEYDQLAIDDLLFDQCLAPYRDFLGVDLVDSDLRLRTIRPNDVRYASEGERTSECLVFPADAVRIRGSAEDTLW
ncbi:MAG: PASTA domain-containing protein [Ilumatobacter sp.]|uniref:PASTA domain-containing protein n=1 Tax=Ilumatobacter sp. TaxID=1967498 RepID=UPI003299148F